MGVVEHSKAGAGADVQDETALILQPAQRARRLREHRLGNHERVRLGHALQRFQQQRVVLGARPAATFLQVLGEGPEILVEGGIELQPAAQELWVGGIEQQLAHVRRETVAVALVPVDELEGIRGAAPDLEVTLVETAQLSGQSLLPNGAAVGNAGEQFGLQPHVNDPRSLVTQHAAEQLLPLLLLARLGHGTMVARAWEWSRDQGSGIRRIGTEGGANSGAVRSGRAAGDAQWQ